MVGRPTKSDVPTQMAVSGGPAACPLRVPGTLLGLQLGRGEQRELHISSGRYALVVKVARAPILIALPS
ncbi:hypothetical protein WJX84_002184 [Apatococcus fuscideae]|uniref:Uncharacterized protein n=1 Tax=Apatococcus fuscideae TaxID=2026836 RepID=A0AAW1T2T5_9CHLO